MRTIYKVMTALEDALRLLEVAEDNGATVCRCREDYECSYCRAKKTFKDAKKLHHNSSVNRPRRDIVCTTTGERFHTIADGARRYGVMQSNISKCLKGDLKTAGKYHGIKLQWVYADDYDLLHSEKNM